MRFAKRTLSIFMMLVLIMGCTAAMPATGAEAASEYISVRNATVYTGDEFTIYIGNAVNEYQWAVHKSSGGSCADPKIEESGRGACVTATFSEPGTFIFEAHRDIDGILQKFVSFSATVTVLDAALRPYMTDLSVTLMAKTCGKTAELFAGQTAGMTVRKATGQVKWTSSDESVVTVSASGKTSAIAGMVSAGRATVTAKTKNGRTYTYVFDVKEPYITLNTDTVECSLYDEDTKFSYEGTRAVLRVYGTSITGLASTRAGGVTFEYAEGYDDVVYVSADSSAMGPVTVTAYCSNGKSYSRDITIVPPYIASEITQFYEPDETHFGTVETHTKKYEYIPAMYYTFQGDSDVTIEAITEVYEEAIKHGANDIYVTFLNGDNSKWVDVGMNSYNIIDSSDGLTVHNTVSSLFWGYLSQFDNDAFKNRNNGGSLDFYSSPGSVHIRLTYTPGQIIRNYMRIIGYPELTESEKELYGIAQGIVGRALEENSTIFSVLLSVMHQIDEGMDYDKTDAWAGCNNMKTADSRGIYQTTVSPVNDARGAFLTGGGICMSYYEAYSICLTILGFEEAPASSRGHIWNTVVLDGRTYHIDACASDGRYGPYFMLSGPVKELKPFQRTIRWADD